MMKFLKTNFKINSSKTASIIFLLVAIMITLFVGSRTTYFTSFYSSTLPDVGVIEGLPSLPNFKGLPTQKQTVKPLPPTQKQTVKPLPPIQKQTVKPLPPIQKQTVKPLGPTQKQTVKPLGPTQKQTVKPLGPTQKQTVKPLGPTQKQTVKPVARAPQATAGYNPTKGKPLSYAKITSNPLPTSDSILVKKSDFKHISGLANDHLVEVSKLL